jgi:protein involved in polysaccharide export with SLBB domain
MRRWSSIAALAIIGLLAIPAVPVLADGVKAIKSVFTATQQSGEGGQAGGQAGGQGGTGQTGNGGAGQGGTGQAGGTGTQGGTGAAGDPGTVQAPPPVVVPEDKGAKTISAAIAPENLRFGDEIFAPTRAAILAARAQISDAQQTGNAFTSPIGPVPLGSVNATPPGTYQLGPGDKLNVRVSAALVDAIESVVAIDSTGSAAAPYTGRKIVLRGLTLAEAEAALTKEIGSTLRNPKVIVTLTELRTYSVSVLGEAFAPGTYQVPATFSLFNLVLATGGPSPRGTLRSIQIRRNGVSARIFDLYSFLIKGDARQDVQLQPGDVIFFPVMQGIVSVTGEVARPGNFEVKGDETLRQLLAYAGGIRPSAVGQNIAIDSVVPGSERRLLNVNVNLKTLTPSSDPAVRDGDKIQVFSIRPIIRNQVTINGSVEQPRSFAYRKGMRVSDLVEAALGLLPEADTTNAEIRRLNPDGTTQLIRVSLKNALQKQPDANFELKLDDVLTIFDVNDIAWRGDRKVTLSGAVRAPGEFYRADGMRVGDLIRQAKGLEPDAFTQEAHIQRYNTDGTPGPLVKVSPLKAAMGDPQHDIVLMDRDVLKVYKITDWQARPAFSVQIKGAVQRPEAYPLAQGMKVRDLIELAGGFTLDIHTKDAFLQRVNPDGTLGSLLLISPAEAMKSDPRHNLELQSGDTLSLYSTKEWRATPELSVEVAGAVQRPGSFGLAAGMKVKDLVSLAGGPALNAHLQTVFLQRTNLDGTLGSLQTLDLAKAMADDPANNLELLSRDKLTVYSTDKARFLIERTVTIMGGVQRPGTFPRGEGMTLKNLLDLAGGLLPNSEGFALIAAANAPEGTNVQKVTVEQAGSWLIKDKDTITVPLDASILAEPIQVIIQGAVANPGVYFFTRRDQKISDLISVAGGLRNEAWVEGSQMARHPEYLRTEAQKVIGPRMLEVLSLIQDDEYKRAIARAEVDRLVFISSSLQGTTPTTIVPTGGGTGVEAAAAPLPSDTVQSAQLVTKARTANAVDLLVGGNMELKLEAALKNTRSPHNVDLKNGDILTIPEKPSTILVDGPGVVLPRSFVYENGLTLRDYLAKAGGFTSDADPGSVLIIRPSGSLFQARPSTKIHLGDVVYVPTRVMVVKMGSTREAFDRSVRTLSNAALVYGFFRSLTK